MRLGSLFLVAAALAASGCAAIQAGRRIPASVSNGELTPGRPPAASYGPDPARTCPAGAVDQVQSALAEKAKASGKPQATPEGRLCAVAEALLGWPKEERPPEAVLRFLSWYYGVELPVTNAIPATLETDDEQMIAESLVQPLTEYANVAPHPRFGLATETLAAKGQSSRAQTTHGTKLWLVMQAQYVDLQPVPRRLELNGTATVSGKLLVPLEKAQVLVSDASGKLETTEIPGSGVFQAPLHCGEKAGRIQVEIRGEQNGAQRTAATFPVACGEALASKVAIPEASGANLDAAQESKKLLEMINADRASAGLPALAWDDGVAKAATAVADELRDAAAKGTAPKIDVVAQLKEAKVSSPVVFANPGEAVSPEEAQANFANSAALRGNYMDREITHAGIGVTSGKTSDGRSAVFVTEVFIKQIAKADVGSVREKLREAIAKTRAEKKATPLGKDAKLDEVAEKYAEALAAEQGGNLPKAKLDALLQPLYKGYRTLDPIPAVETDPLAVTGQKDILDKGKVVGIGVAQGNHPTLGKNAFYVVVLIGTHK